jgi:hypothetical protein
VVSVYGGNRYAASGEVLHYPVPDPAEKSPMGTSTHGVAAPSHPNGSTVFFSPLVPGWEGR